MSRNEISIRRRIIVALLGFPVIVTGVLLLVLPGPGIVLIVTGLLILAQEFVWAEKLAEAMKKQAKKVMPKKPKR